MMHSADVTRVEVQTGPSTWLNVTGESVSLKIERTDGDVGTLSAVIADATLDPTQTSTIRFGRLVRISAKQGSGWKVIYTGTIDTIDVDYHPLDRHSVTLALTANDNVAFLANTEERRGVASLNSLRGLLNGVGVAFNINGQTTPIGAPTVVATNDGSSLWQQILNVRDSALAYAWVDQENRLQVRDLSFMDAAIKATIGPSAYRDVEVDFNSGQIINSVTVSFQRYAPTSDTTTEITYGPYEDAASIADWGRYSATVTYQSLVEDEEEIETFAQAILDRNAEGAVRVKSVTLPIRTEADLPLTYLDLNNVVTVTLTDETTEHTLRIVSVTHDITGDRWLVTLDLDLPDGLAMPSNPPGTGVSIVPEGSVGTPQLQPGAVGTNEISFTHRDIGGITTTVSATSPTGAVEGDLWIDEDNQRSLHRWDGSTWVPVRDEGILDAIDVANDAQTSADGKNTVIRSTSVASNPGNYKSGDLWFRYTGSNVIGMWLHDGSAWVAQTLRNEVIATLDAAKITTGVLNASRIAAGSISGSHLKADAIDGKHITGAVIDGGQINGGEINGVEINGGTLTSGNTSGRHAVVTGGSIGFYNGSTYSGYVSGSNDGGVIVGSAEGSFVSLSAYNTSPIRMAGVTVDASGDFVSSGLVRLLGEVQIAGGGSIGFPGRSLTGEGFDSGWQNLTAGSGWTLTGAQYRIIGGVVYFRGRATRPSGSNNTITTLPAQARPATAQYCYARSGNQTNININTSGTIVAGSGYSTGNNIELTSIPPYPLD